MVVGGSLCLMATSGLVLGCGFMFGGFEGNCGCLGLCMVAIDSVVFSFRDREF